MPSGGETMSRINDLARKINLHSFLKSTGSLAITTIVVAGTYFYFDYQKAELELEHKKELELIKQKHEQYMAQAKMEMAHRMAVIDKLQNSKDHFVVEFRKFSNTLLSENKVVPSARESVVSALQQQLMLSESLESFLEENSAEIQLLNMYRSSIDEVRRSVEGLDDQSQLGDVFEKISAMMVLQKDLVLSIKKASLFDDKVV